MSFDNDYPNRKDWRKPYSGSKVFDAYCRNHGRCPYCANNRCYNVHKHRFFADKEIKDWKNNEEF